MTTDEQLRDALSRLSRQEERTSAVEAALFAEHDAETWRDPVWGYKTAASANPDREGGGGTRNHPVAHAPGSPEVSAAAVLDSLDDVVWSVSPDGQVVFFLAGAVTRTFGRTANELRDTPGAWLDALPHDDRKEMRAALARVPDTDLLNLEHRVRTPGGLVRWLHTRGRLVRDRDGRPLRIDGTTTDITPRVRSRRAVFAVLEGVGAATGQPFLDKLVKHLAEAFEARAAVVAVPDPATPHAARTAALFLDGQPAENFTFGIAAGLMRDVFAGGPHVVADRARDAHPTDELLARLRAESVVAEPLFDESGVLVGVLALIDDRPARPDARTVLRALAPRVAAELNRPYESPERVLQLEEQLRHARRLETAGRLVAGVSHDFNNLLTIIGGNAELIRETLPPADPLRDPAELIAATAHTAAGVSRQLLALSRPHAPHPGPLDLNAAVRVVERMLARAVGDRITLDVTLAAGVPLILADPGQVDQVLLNLVLNARDAIADTGTVTLRTAVAHVEPTRPGWPAELPPGEYAALTVTDTGSGMTDEVRAKVFDLFFTTKPTGTGVGLATVRDVVRGAGGHVEVESSPGWGTSVRAFWPRATSPESGEIRTRPRPMSHGETILLVQDGNELRDVTVLTLQQAGYRVLEAANGESAEERSRLYTGAIDLVVTDLALPSVGGREVAERLRAARLGLRVLFTSGHPPPAALGGAFLAKPYTSLDLLEAVRAALE